MCLGLIATRVPRTPANIILEAERNGWEGCAHSGQEFFLKRYFGYSDGYEGEEGTRASLERWTIIGGIRGTIVVCLAALIGWRTSGYATARKCWCLRRGERTRGRALIITAYNWERNHVSVEKYFRATLHGIPIRWSYSIR